MSETDFAIGVLSLALPLPATTTTGVVLENETKNPIYEVVGKTLQMTSITILKGFSLLESLSNKLFWMGLTEPAYSTSDTSPEALAWWKSVGTVEERQAFSDFWAPKITFCITSAFFLTPLMIKGLKMGAEKYELHIIKNFLEIFDGVFMTGVKVINIALITYGLILSTLSGSPLMIGVYLSLFLLNFYPIASKLTHDYLIPYLISNYQEKSSA